MRLLAVLLMLPSLIAVTTSTREIENNNQTLEQKKVGNGHQSIKHETEINFRKYDGQNGMKAVNPKLKQQKGKKRKDRKHVNHQVLCDELKNIPNGYVRCLTIDDNTSNCTVTCDDNYILSNPSRTHFKCPHDMKLKKQSSLCKPKVCDDIVLLNGKVTCSDTKKVGSTCSLLCNQKYELSSESCGNITCQPSGKWTGSVPQCLLKTCDSTGLRDVPNGIVHCSGQIQENEVGSECEYICNYGFTIEGKNKRKCMEYNNSKEWDLPPPTCERAQCSMEYTKLENGHTKCMGAEIEYFRGSVCNYSCFEGYYLNGDISTKCEKNNEWSHIKPVCEVRTCTDDYLAIPNGNVVCYGPNIWNWYNSECVYTCDPGYKLNGNHSAKCKENKKWSTEKPTCERIRCNTPPLLIGGNFSCSTSTFEYLTTCNLSCYNGYNLTGNPEISCMSNEVWTINGNCDEISCPSKNLQLANGFVECKGGEKWNSYDSKCTYVCDLGYVLNGTNSVACQLNGEWSDQKPTCEDKFCTLEYLSIDNGIVNCFGTEEFNRFGSTCQYTCNTGYELVGNHSVSCENNGMWTSIKPKCKVKLCEAPPVVNDGKLECNSSHFEYLTACSLTCRKGYEAQGSQSIKCSENGVWTQHGYCLGISCSKENTEINNGNVVCEGAETYNMYESRCNYSCYAGYILNGTESAQCQSDGNWSDQRPICEAITCSEDYLKIENGFVNCRNSIDEDMYGSTCFYTCVEGYELVGNKSVTCDRDHEWIPIKPVCQEFNCSKVPLLEGGEFICSSTDYKFKTVCQLSCKDGYDIAGPSNITCMVNKEWSASGTCVDTEAPKFPFGCPQNIRIDAQIHGLQNQVQYSYPEVLDNSGSDNIQIKGDPDTNSTFQVGSTLVNVTAIDKAGNVGECSFKITVESNSCDKPNVDISGNDLIHYTCPNQYLYGASCEMTCKNKIQIKGTNRITCTKDDEGNYVWTSDGNVIPLCEIEGCGILNQPNNGYLTCSNIGDGIETCNIICNHNFTTLFQNEQQYTCLQSSGKWLPSNSIPNCYPRKLPKSVRMRPTFYYYVTSCDVETENNVTENGSFTFDTFIEFCRDINKTCEVTGFGCSAVLSSDERYSFELKVTTEIHLGTYLDKGSYSHTLHEYESMANEINELIMTTAESKKFEMPKLGVFNNIDYPEMEFVCDIGESIVYSTLSCAGCGPGNYFNDSTGSCIKCPVGFYQDTLVSLSCLSCPNGTTTLEDGATTLSDCLNPCKEGEVSENGSYPCERCPIGTYQQYIGKTRCVRCPFGMSTTHDGQTSINSCQFYEFYPSSNNSVVMLSKYDLDEFTLMAWIHNLKVLNDSDATDTPIINVDTITVKLLQQINNTAHQSEWNHIALVYTLGDSILYYNGVELQRFSTQNISSSTDNFIRFYPSSGLNAIKFHGFQMANRKYSELEILQFSKSCNKQVKRHLLLENPFSKLQLNASLCTVPEQITNGTENEFQTTDSQMEYMFDEENVSISQGSVNNTIDNTTEQTTTVQITSSNFMRNDSSESQPTTTTRYLPAPNNVIFENVQSNEQTNRETTKVIGKVLPTLIFLEMVSFEKLICNTSAKDKIHGSLIQYIRNKGFDEKAFIIEISEKCPTKITMHLFVKEPTPEVIWQINNQFKLLIKKKEQQIVVDNKSTIALKLKSYKGTCSYGEKFSRGWCEKTISKQVSRFDNKLNKT